MPTVAEDTMKSLYQLAQSRRSVRKYTSEPVTDDAIRRILSVALTAPNSFGHRPVEYIVVRDPERIRAINRNPDWTDQGGQAK